MATTIQIQNETREKLKRFGHKGELIEQRWERLQKEKSQYLSLDEI